MKKFTLLFFAIVSFAACKSKDDDFAQHVITYKQYFPMQVGSLQLYRMDSTVPTAFGAQLVVHSYIAKDSISDQRLDATGDTTYNIYRFITDTLQAQPWTLSTTYQIIFTKNTVDLIQPNGLRFIKLTTPVVNGNSWDGNQYFVTGNNQSSEDPYYAYEGWNYVYDSVGMTYQTYSNTLIVQEINKALPQAGPFDPNQYQQVQYAQEIYAENTGLIYQNILFYIYQPPNALSSGFDASSFGIRLTRIQ